MVILYGYFDHHHHQSTQGIVSSITEIADVSIINCTVSFGVNLIIIILRIAYTKYPSGSLISHPLPINLLTKKFCVKVILVLQIRIDCNAKHECIKLLFCNH